MVISRVLLSLLNHHEYAERVIIGMKLFGRMKLKRNNSIIMSQIQLQAATGVITVLNINQNIEIIIKTDKSG